MLVLRHSLNFLFIFGAAWFTLQAFHDESVVDLGVAAIFYIASYLHFRSWMEARNQSEPKP